MPRIALLALLILSCGNLQGQPVNDLCEDAIELDFENRLDANGVVSLGAVVEGSTAAANPDADGLFPNAPGVWYSFVGNGDLITANTCGAGNDYDTALSVFSGECGALEMIIQNDDACTRPGQCCLTMVEWVAEEDVTYLVLVHGWSTSRGNYSLELFSGDAPPVEEDDDNDGVPNEQDNCIDIFNPDQVDIDGDGIGDLCDDEIINPGVPENDFCFDAIELDFEKRLDANGVVSLGAVVEGSTAAATPDADGLFPNAPGVWYSFVGNGDLVTANTCGAGNDYDTALSVFSGGCGAIEMVVQSDDACTRPGQCCLSVVEWNAEEGVTYLVLVHGWSTSRGNYILEFVSGDAPPIGDDVDRDGVPDGEDNCIDIFNPDQGDIDGDGFGDACDDVIINPDAPENDLCEGAIEIVLEKQIDANGVVGLGAVIEGGTFAAAPDAESVFCGASNAPGIWYSLIGNASTMRIDTCGDFSDYDTRLSVFSGDCANLNCIVSNDDACTNANGCCKSVVEWNAEEGVTYLVLVHGWSASSGSYVLSVTSGDAIPGGDEDNDNDGVINRDDNCVNVANPDQLDGDGDGLGDACDGGVINPAAPENDFCDEAIELVFEEEIDAAGRVGLSATVDGNTSEATPDPESSFCGASNAPGVWYSLVGTGELMRAETCGSTYDTRLSVYEGGCAELLCVTSNDDACGLQTIVDWEAVEGVTYLVLAHGWNTSEGDYTLLVRNQGALPEDDDGDGVPNEVDNCVDRANPNQADIDGDGVGDACDADSNPCIECERDQLICNEPLDGDFPRTGCSRTSGQSLDFFSLDVDGGQVTIDLTGTYDTFIQLFDDTCQLIAQDDDGGVGLNSRLVQELPGGTYFVGVSSFGVGQAGAFTLSAQCEGGLGTFCDRCDSGVLRVGEATGGELGAGGCRLPPFDQPIEVFSLEIDEIFAGTISVTSEAFEPNVSFWNDFCDEVAFNDNCPRGDADACLDIELGPGTYTVVVSSEVAAAAGAFSISVEVREVVKNPPDIFSRGDVDSSGLVNLTDAVQVLNYLFQAGVQPGCMETADTNNDTQVNLTDVVFLLNYLFLSGEPPPAPGPPNFGSGCGTDPDALGSPGDLGCESFTGCE